MPLLKMQNLNLKNKRVLIREDFNVPIQNGKVVNDARLIAALPTIQQALAQGAAVILLSHLGRPEEGVYDEQSSLAPIAEYLARLLKHPVRFESVWLEGIHITPGEVVLCENVRFNKGENKNDPELAKKMAALGDIFIMDAFATAHRAQASTYGIAEYTSQACAGPLLSAELDALSKAMAQPEHPVVAIVGGSKVSTKLTILESLLKITDQLIVGGGIANTFIAAAGYKVGKSLYEPELVATAKQLLAKYPAILLPEDVVVAREFAVNATAVTKAINAVAEDEMILDIGAKTAKYFAQVIQQAKTILWNGPVGVFEFPNFANGTQAVAEAIAKSSAFSIAGGGDTLSAIDQFNVAEGISYISTGGGAFLEYIEGKQLPAIEILEKRAHA